MTAIGVRRRQGAIDLRRLCSDEAAVERVARAIDPGAWKNLYLLTNGDFQKGWARAQERARAAARRALAEMAKIAEERGNAEP